MNISLALKAMAVIEVLVSGTRMHKFPVTHTAGASMHLSSVLGQSILGFEDLLAAFILCSIYQFMEFMFF